MKFSTILLISIGSATDLSVSPIEKLVQLTDMASELLETDAFKLRTNKHDRWLTNWNRKFVNNAKRMERSYKKCGTEYGEQDTDFIAKLDRENPCNGISDLMSGIWTWANRYLSTCKVNRIQFIPGMGNQLGIQQSRLVRWINKFYKGKG